MSEFKYPHLFEPIVLGRQFFRNRIFNSPTGVAIEPERYSCAYYERKAVGGAASVCIGDASPTRTAGPAGCRSTCGTMTRTRNCRISRTASHATAPSPA